MRRARSAVCAGLATLLAACAANSGVGETPAGAGEERTSMPTLETVTESVMDDAAKRTGLERTRLVVESASAVIWADGALGCPEPGMNYTMALVPGYRIIIRAGEQRLDYHASRRGHFVLCPAGRSAEPVGDAAR